MKISIVTTVYNAEKYIERTVESVIGQNYPELEYIITDGNSTDSTLSLLAKYPQIRVVSESDNGIFDGMNKGLLMCSGDWIGILNAGDTYEHGVFKDLMNFVKDNPTVEAVHGRMLWVRNGKSLFEVGKPIPNKIKLYKMPVKHPTLFVSRDVYELHGKFDDSQKIGADHKLVHHFIQRGVKFDFLDRIVTRMEAGGASAVHRKIKRDEVLSTIVEFNGTLQDHFFTWYEYYLKTIRDCIVKNDFFPKDSLRRIYRKLRF